MRIFRHLLIIIIFYFSFFYSCCVFAKDTPSIQENYDSYDITFPVGSYFKAILQQKISTASNTVNDKVELILPYELHIRGVTCIPQNTKIIGKIVRLEPGKIGKNGYFQVIFTTFILPDGQKFETLGHIWTKKGDGLIGGEITNRSGARKMVHYVEGIGAFAQVMPDGPRVKGKETEVLPGTDWIIVLDRELKLNIPKE